MNCKPDAELTYTVLIPREADPGTSLHDPTSETPSSNDRPVVVMVLFFGEIINAVRGGNDVKEILQPVLTKVQEYLLQNTGRARPVFGSIQRVAPHDCMRLEAPPPTSASTAA
jgi:hypothetical protein